jgi:hypothetical protein
MALGGDRGDVMGVIEPVEILLPRYCGILLQLGISMSQPSKNNAFATLLAAC